MRSPFLAIAAFAVANLACSCSMAPLPFQDRPLRLATGKDAKVTHDGLYAVAHPIFDAAFVRPGVDFGRFDQVFIEPLQISSEYTEVNAERARDREFETGADYRLSQTNLDRLVSLYAEQMAEGFKKARGRTIRAVERPGERTLRLSTIVLRFTLSAPSDQSRNIEATTYGGIAARITVMSEFRDATSGEVLLRFADTKSAVGNWQMNNDAAAMKEAKWAFSVWANTYRRRLEVLRKQGAIEL